MSYDVQKVTLRETACCAINAERKTGQCKNELFWHCRRAINAEGGDLKAGLELFLAGCADEEMWMTSKVAGQMRVENVPDLWMQGKSDIKRAIENGIDIRGYESYHKMREAKIEESKARKAEAAAPKGAARAERDTTVVRTVEEALASGEVVDAKATTLCPEDLLPIVALLHPLTELHRQRAVARMFNIAQEASANHKKGIAEGLRRKAG